jgi:hypothetical protein
MPPSYIALHFLLCGLCLAAALAVPPRSRLARILALVLLLAIAGGLLVERRPDWAWSAMLLRSPDLVFFTNLSLEGVTVLVALLWRSLKGPARWRAAALTPLALGAAVWSYAWYVAPLPSGLRGTADARGLCTQTTQDSCCAAAAVTLLHHAGIRATEAEMAALCVTRAGHGTPPLGLYRGLSIKAAGRGKSPRLVMARSPGELAGLGGPAIVSIGLAGNAPAAVAARMREYGWVPGLRHAVVILRADPAGKWLDVADPSYGLERWPIRRAEDLDYLWDGRALVLDPSQVPGGILTQP